jgi:hypothetical protein
LTPVETIVASSSLSSIPSMSVTESTSSKPKPFDGHGQHSLIPIHLCSGNSYVVASMQLMSTTFRRVDGSVSGIRAFRPDLVPAKHGISRSTPTSETTSYELSSSRTFDVLVPSLKALRELQCGRPAQFRGIYANESETQLRGRLCN